MSENVEFPFEYARDVVQALLKSTAAVEDCQRTLMALQTRWIEESIQAARKSSEAVGAASDWSSFPILPIQILVDQMERNTSFLLSYAKHHGEAWDLACEQCRDAFEATMTQQKDTLRGKGHSPVANAMTEFLAHMSRMAQLASPGALSPATASAS